MLEPYYNQYVNKIPTIRNAYGDIIIDYTQEVVAIGCRFRVITNMQRSNNREELHSEQAMVWFAPNTDIAQNDIIFYEDQYWQITKINEARRLGSTRVEFLKCYASTYGVVS